MRKYSKILKVTAILLILTSLLIGFAGCSEGKTQDATTETTQFIDHEPPVISGVRDHQVKVGGSVDFMEGITVTDNTDPEPKLTVISNTIFFDYPGTYRAIYIAVDAEGNQSMEVSTVTITE